MRPGRLDYPPSARRDSLARELRDGEMTEIQMRLPRHASPRVVTTLLMLSLLGCSNLPTDADSPGSPDTGPDTTPDADGAAALTPEAFIAEQQLADDGPGGQDEVTCRIERPLGSHIRKKVCTTETERQREAIEARHLMKTRQEVTRK